jgi:hypothetical protein
MGGTVSPVAAPVEEARQAGPRGLRPVQALIPRRVRHDQTGTRARLVLSNVAAGKLDQMLHACGSGGLHGEVDGSPVDVIRQDAREGAPVTQDLALVSTLCRGINTLPGFICLRAYVRPAQRVRLPA